ncbi:MAG: hypothetical protein H6862_07580 [Rhodospirillales bacterium]|nr:hypothetical protein [Rhodospirillales bacterium]
METQLENVLRRMIDGDFSDIDSVRTRSGTEYRILSAQEEARPETVALRPAFARCAEGRLTLLGRCYGRAQEKKKPDGTPAFPEGCTVTTTPISSIVLRNSWRDALCESFESGAFHLVKALQTSSGKLYAFSTQEAVENGSGRRFVPGRFFNHQGSFLFFGRLYGDPRYSNGSEVGIQGVSAVILANGQKVDIRKSVLNLETVETAVVGIAPS